MLLMRRVEYKWRILFFAANDVGMHISSLPFPDDSAFAASAQLHIFETSSLGIWILKSFSVPAGGYVRDLRTRTSFRGLLLKRHFRLEDVEE